MTKRIIVVVLLVAFIACCLLVRPAEEDAPGGWVPSPVGSDWCVAQGIPRIPNGTVAHCQRP